MSEYKPHWPRDGGPPVCDDECPLHDSKRCRWTGTRAGYGVCDAWAADALAALREIDDSGDLSIHVRIVGDQ